MTDITLSRPLARGPLGNRFTRHGARTLWILTALLVGIAAGCGILAATFTPWLYVPAGISLGLWIFCLSFFRNPRRQAPGEEHLVVAPADGKIFAVEQVEETEWVDGPATRILIFLSVFNVHVNRSPVEGVVDYLDYRTGTFRNALDREARETNERQSLGLTMADGTRVLVRQIAGKIARRIVCPVQKGERLAQGFDYGMIQFGSQTEISVPDRDGRTFQLRVAEGDVLKGGETILGAWE